MEFPVVCWCGDPVQDSTGLDHRCRQCAAHCRITGYRAAIAAATRAAREFGAAGHPELWRGGY